MNCKAVERPTRYCPSIGRGHRLVPGRGGTIVLIAPLRIVKSDRVNREAIRRRNVKNYFYHAPGVDLPIPPTIGHVCSLDVSGPATDGECVKENDAFKTNRRDFIVFASASTFVAVMSEASAFDASSPVDERPLAHSTEENADMPLVRFDALDGRSDAEIKTLLDAAHRAIVRAFHINDRDRYQVYSTRPKPRFVMQDTGLGIPRTDKMLVITVYSKSRSEILKKRLYQEMTEELSRSSSVAKSDVMICIVENSSADWSFGNGEAQFLTGDLA